MASMPSHTPVRRRNRLQDLVDDYLLHRRAAGVGSHARAAYGFALRRVFLPFCERQGISDPEQLTTRVLNRLRAELMEHGPSGRPLSPHSINTYCRHVNYFLSWLQSDDVQELSRRVRAAQPAGPESIRDVGRRGRRAGAVRWVKGRPPTARLRGNVNGHTSP